MIRTLIVEDDTTFAELLEGFLTRNHHEVKYVTKVKDSFKLLESQTFDLLLTDYRLPDGTGLDVLAFVREHHISLPTIVMTSFNDVRTAVRSIQSGATDYIIKPVNPEELSLAIKKALDRKEHHEGVKISDDETGFIKGQSVVADKLHEYIQLVAPTDLSVLLQGESGTGKEFAARMLHQQSDRKHKPFVAVDCGALSKDLAASELFGHVKGAFTGALNDKKGKFEVANGGTFFMDEIGNLSYEVQVKLLRALQERVVQPLGSNKTIKVDVRIIAATNDDLVYSIQSGDFREDLYHRINQFKIQLPPLRERAEDLELFIEHFIKASNKELGRQVKGMDAEAKSLLLNYDWPGNLRELSNVVKRMVLLTPGELASAGSLPEEMILAVNHPSVGHTSDLKAFKEVNEKVLIQETLIKVRYNKSKAAKILNIDRKTLYSKMERYGIE